MIPPPDLVQKEMQELIEWHRFAVETKAKHPLVIIANFIFECLAIHPFQDGNGRTSRLLTNLMLLRQNYLFASIISHEQIVESNKLDYYKSLNTTQRSWKTDQEDVTPWLFFFLECIRTQSRKALKILQEDRIEYRLSEKQLVVWQWIYNRGTTFTRKEAVEALQFPERTIESIFKKLMDLQRIRRPGQGRATRYKIME